MERKIFTVTTIICLITFLGIIAGVSAETIDIEGPWLWMIAPVPFNQGGAASIQLDSLAEMSCGVVTEQMIATNGAKAGDPVGNYQWTPGEISVERPGWLDLGDGNINDTLNAIEMITGNVNHATAYALINIESSAAQAATIKVGSDDAIKVWLNGVVVHTNAINRSTTDYQDAFGVNLNAGDNLLMVKVSEQERKWRMFVGLDVPNPNTLGFHIPQRKVPIVGNVTFSNLDLANGVRQALSLPAGADIPKAQLAILTELSVPGAGIANLTGLEHATQLEVLDLSDNQIDDLSPLTGLINLTELDLSDNEITDVSPLTGLTRLRNLHLNNNLIKDSNMIPLGDLINLTLHFDAAYQTTNAYGSTVYNYNDGTGNETVLIKGLKLKKWDSTVTDNTNPACLPDVSSPPFKVYKQPNDWTCGHTSALMLLNYYGIDFSTPEEGRNLFNDLAKGSWSIECYSELLTVYPNLLISAALSNMAKKLLLACVPGASDLVYQLGPGTLPHEMAIGLNKLFPFPTEVRNGTGDVDSQRRFLEDQVSRSCPPIILLKLKGMNLHWVVVVGYDTKEEKFLIADPSPPKGSSWGKFKWKEWSDHPSCGPSLMEAWSLKYLGDNLCPFDVSWVPGAAASLLLLSGGTQYFAVIPTEAPPYHDPIKSQTFRIKTGGAIDPRKWAYEWDWVLEGDEKDAGVVIDCKWSFARKEDSVVSVICNEGEKKVTVSGKPEAGLGQRIDVDMFLTVYYEGTLDLTLTSAPPAPSIVLSGPEINTSLLPNYPNPFNPETWLPYQLSEPAEVKLTIYDIQGRVVRALDVGHQRAGMYHSRSRAAHWDGRNAVGEPVASGIYFYTLKAGDFFATRKMLIRK